MKELNGKVALVTGGTRGIGRAAAEKLASLGAAVILTGRDAAQGKAVERGIKEAGGNGHFVSQDVSKSADWRAAGDQIRSRFGRLDILVQSAGIAGGMPIKDMPVETFRTMINTNFKAVFYGLRLGAEMMRISGGGSIVLVGSIVGLVGVEGHTHYAAAKDGVRLMAKAAALELGPEKIRVNSLHPGMIRTDMTKGFPEKAIAPMIPLGRFGEPEEMAEAVAFLAGPRSAYMTGAELVADGGWIAR